MKILFYLSIITFFVQSCGSQPEDNLTEVTEDVEEKKPLIDTMKWILGAWTNSTPAGDMTETWNQTADSVLSGIVVATYADVENEGVMITDTLESIQIKQEWGNLYYIPAVADQNKGMPVKFKMTGCDGEKFVFENPEHDFPTKIVYQRFGADSLVATISGIWEGKEVAENFPMKKIK